MSRLAAMSASEDKRGQCVTSGGIPAIRVILGTQLLDEGRRA